MVYEGVICISKIEEREHNESYIIFFGDSDFFFLIFSWYERINRGIMMRYKVFFFGKNGGIGGKTGLNIMGSYTYLSCLTWR